MRFAPRSTRPRMARMDREPQPRWTADSFCLFQAPAGRRTPVGCLGSHFALSKQQADEVCQLSGEEERYDFFEQRPWDKKWSLYGDKFWDGLHRCLTDGTLDDRDPPLGDVILGDGWGEMADTGGYSYYANVLDHDQVRQGLDA